MDNKDFLEGTFDPYIGHEIVEIKENYVKSSLDVKDFHKQPMGRDVGQTLNEKNPEWRYPPPKTGNEATLKYVCLVGGS